MQLLDEIYNTKIITSDDPISQIVSICSIPENQFNSDDFNEIMKWINDQPNLLSDIVEEINQSMIDWKTNDRTVLITMWFAERYWRSNIEELGKRRRKVIKMVSTYEFMKTQIENELSNITKLSGTNLCCEEQTSIDDTITLPSYYADQPPKIYCKMCGRETKITI